MQFTIKVEWQREDGSLATEEMDPVDVGPCQSAADVGLQLADGQRILAWLQEIVVSAQLQWHCEVKRLCPVCHRQRHLKDNRSRQFHTVFGNLNVRAPRFDACCGCRSVLKS